MTPNEREWGKIEEQIEQLIHRSRNDRQLIVGLGEQVDALAVALERLKSRIYAAVAVVMALAGVIAWLVDVAISVRG